jgi:RNA polymerase sigma-70 factor (TIGR02960 family)
MTLTESDAMPTDLDFDRYRRELHVHCYRMLGSYTDAEDQVQETFIRAWRHRADFEDGTNLRAWLYRIATNVCIDAIRALGRQAGERAEATWLQPYPDDPETATLDRETIELAFIAAVQTLPPRQRAVLVLNAALDWTPSEIAKSLEMTSPAVNSALQRARRRC